MTIDLLAAHEMPSWFDYPRAYVRLVAQGLIDLTPWYFLDRARMLKYAEEMNARYGAHRLPFARRQDKDDVACFEKGRGNAVVLVQDGLPRGTEVRKQFDDVWGWFRSAVEDMIEWDP